MSRSGFDFCDDLGPERILQIYQPSIGLKAVVVVDNIAAGPAIGGVRMAPDVSVEECFGLARSMTLKNAAAGLSHGGGKSVIFGDPRMPAREKERIVRAFACAIGDESGYIAGPDMGTNEICMAWMKDEIGRAVGLPRELGGIPLDEIGATGFGLAVAATIAAPFCDLDLRNARVVVQGFGAVGQHAARFLAAKGAVLVAASDSRGAVYNSDGLDIEALIATKRDSGHLADHNTGVVVDRDAVIGIECDIWIPAARPNALRGDNVEQLSTKLVLEGANIPATAEAELWLHNKNVLVIPDFIANAGGVICAAVEYAGGTEAAALQFIEEKISLNTSQVLSRAQSDAVTPRAVADAMASVRVRKAMATRRWSSPNL